MWEILKEEKEEKKRDAPLGEVFFLNMFMLALILEMRKP